MSIRDYLLNLLLVGLVVFQMRGKRLTATGLSWPMALVVGAGVKYLGRSPGGAADLVLLASGGTLGAVLGCLCGRTTHVYARGSTVVARASGVAAALWVAGVGARVAFAFWATHGGGPVIGRFSAEHGIDGARAWASCLVLMALAEVSGRTAVLAWRARAVRRAAPVLPASAVTGAEAR